MRHSSETSTLFCEQVSTVTSLFEKWNDCERTVVIYALLKRLRYSNLKFLHHSIENNLAQNSVLYNSMPTFDINANSHLYLENLVSAYKTLSVNDGADNTDKDTMYFGSEYMFKNDGKSYNKKEDILSEVLQMLPLLKPGNEEAKLIYLSLIPMAVEDTGREIVSTELVQQIFSYLLIHPAISNEDRRSLTHWLRNLEDNIQSSYGSAGQQSFVVLSNNTDACLSNSSTSVASSVGSLTSKNPWQAIAPPQQSTHKSQQQSQPSVSDKSGWNVNIPTISDNICDNFSGIKINELGSSQNSLGLSYGGTADTVSNSNANTNTEDHHTSFSRNGTEILDFESNSCDSCSCNQMGYASLLNTCDNYNENRWSLDGKMSCIKTRRSNSLTTAISSFTSPNATVTTVNDNCSNSSENLAQYSQKPRSFSLSIENPRTSMKSSDSDSRLDDLKPNYLKFSTQNSGMSNIGQWLKSLRLHKYIDLFKNITYEAMLEITEEYLQELGVTKGASHKLALCIEKLNERENLLIRIEQDFIQGLLKVNIVIEELAGIVLTPMKPVNSVSQNVAYRFLTVVDLVCSAILQRESFGQQDEESVSVLLWILERMMQGEVFSVHLNQLKELKFKLSKLKMSFAPKAHHLKTASSSNLSKPRWNCKTRKVDQKNGSNDKINRKNSTDMVTFSPNCSQQQQQQQRTPMSKSINNPSNSCTQYKSSSYPNFISGTTIPVQSFQPPKPQNSQQPPSMFVNQTNFPSTSTTTHQQQHRRSLNNLIVVSPGQGTLSNSTVVTCGAASNSPMSPKPTSSSRTHNVKNRKSTSNSNLQLAADQQPKPTSSSSSNVTSKKTLEKTMAAVVLVSNTNNNNELDNFSNFEKNNNNVNLNRTSKVCSVGVCTSSNSCVSAALSNNICSAITSNFIISPTSSLLLDNEKHLKNNNISDIKSLEQLEFLCLQMTEQAIN